MEVIRKDEDDWWFAKHSDGRKGSIPVPYVQIVSVLLLPWPDFFFSFFLVNITTRCKPALVGPSRASLSLNKFVIFCLVYGDPY